MTPHLFGTIALCLVFVAGGCTRVEPVAIRREHPIGPQDVTFVPADSTAFTWNDGVWICTGAPKGYLCTKKPLRNGIVRLELRFRPTPAGELDLSRCNTGVLLLIDEPGRIWPRCLEVQGKFAEMGRLKANGGAETPAFREQAHLRDEHTRHADEWNNIEVSTNEGVVSVRLNGHLISEGESAHPFERAIGHMGLQAEGQPWEIRGWTFEEK